MAMFKTIRVRVCAQYRPSGGSPREGGLEYWHPTFGWVKRQHCGGSSKKFTDFFSPPVFLPSVLHTDIHRSVKVAYNIIT